MNSFLLYHFNLLAVLAVFAFQPSSWRVALEVQDAALPVTIGIPLARSAAILDPARLIVVEAEGSSLPAHFRVLARWDGPPEDRRRPLKWVLADFQPRRAGPHFVTIGTPASQKSIEVVETPSGWRVRQQHLEIVPSRQGEALIHSVLLGGDEWLRAPATWELRLPARALLTEARADQLIVNDATAFQPGRMVRFEHRDKLKWDAPAGSSRLVTFDQSFAANRRYRLGEGGATMEEVEVVSAQPGDLRTAAPLRFSHLAGTTIRDLTVESETATIKAIRDQIVQLTAPPTVPHVAGEIVATSSPGRVVRAFVESASIEESSDRRVVVRQEGRFPGTTLAFTARYEIHAEQPFVRLRLRLMNRGVYGFGTSRTKQAPFPQHVLLESLSFLVPTKAGGTGLASVLKEEEALARLRRPRATPEIVAAGDLEIASPELAENFPKLLRGDGEGLRFDLLPRIGVDYLFEGGRAKTTEIFLGRGATQAMRLATSLNASLDPAYVVGTGAVRPAMIERREWRTQLAADPALREAAQRFERMLAGAYAVEVNEAAGAVPKTSIQEYRLRGENGPQFGWRHFGDLAWGDGYANVHYDLPFNLLRESLRTGDRRAFRFGGEMARYRADWGHYRADDYLDRERTWNLRGLAFYEKGEHGSFREPVPSHTWIEGMWLYWAMTGDEAVRESAVEASEAFARMKFTYAGALGWNEPRWLGWPTLGLVVAWRYTGEERYLAQARANVRLFLQAEEAGGRKGYYLHRAPDVLAEVQPWAWAYALLGVIEYWRETEDPEVAAFLVRVADWMIGSSNPPLKPSVRLADGSYLPQGVSYFWRPEKVAEDRSLSLAGLCLPVLTAAARITNRPDLWERARALFIDYAFYRDLPDGQAIPPARRATINFRSLQFPASATKVYGQMGLTVTDFLPAWIAHTQEK